ncbi:MAG: hypothetical protein CSA96_07975, partial [Bacteroidetes bacterium]
MTCFQNIGKFSVYVAAYAGRVFSFVLLLLVFHSLSLGAQSNPDSLLVFRFIKPEVEMDMPGSYFNVLELINNNDEALEAVVRFSGPDGWRFVSRRADSLYLAPGQSVLIPVRISIPKSTVGGISFVIGAELFSEGIYDYANAYLSLSRSSKWEMRLKSSQVFISGFRPYGDMAITLDNRGNSNELVKLTFDVGGLLEFKEAPEADSFLFVALPAYKDTTLSFQIRRKEGLRYMEQQALKNDYWARSVKVTASTPDRQQTGNVRATMLNSREVNSLPGRNSPLNAELSLYNLLSAQKTKTSGRVFGRVLFPENRQLQYSLGFFNLYFDPDMNRSMNLVNRFRYMARYDDPTTMVWLGDRLGVGEIHSLSGRGVRARHLLFEDHTLSLNIVQNPFTNNIGGHLGYEGFIGKLNWNTGATVETGFDGSYGHYSAHLGGNYRLFEKHAIGLQTVSTLSHVSAGRYLDDDRRVLGVAYRFTYRYNDQRMMLSFNNMNTRFTYLRNSGVNRISVNGRYLFTRQLRLIARYFHNYYTSTRYPYNFEHPASFSVNDHGRVLLSYNTGGITYQGGPNYNAVVRRYYNSRGDYMTTFSNYQPGLMGSVAFRIGRMRTITPNFSVQTMHYRYGNTDPKEELPGMTNNWRYTAGVNYYDHAFKLTAYYSSGDAADLYRSVVIEEDPEINQSFHVRPYYERFFLKEKIRLSVFVNYSYYMPSLRENTLMNLSCDFYLKNSWNLYSNFNIYQVSRNDTELGRMTTRDVNLMLGLRKSFDIQQPRMAYYDLTIIGFNDLNGDGIKDENEKPISNVLINISRDPDKNTSKRSGFAEVSMITDPQGEVYYENLPEGVYDLSITPLSNLENLFFLHGNQQTIDMIEDKIHYLPLVESYKVMGRILIDRDPNSNEGIVSPEGIRITATGENGEKYSTLTTGYGTYVLDLPRSSSYEVNVYNVFGENFRLERGTYRVQFTENRTINLDFRFI